jgi:hypothetical protein
VALPEPGSQAFIESWFSKLKQRCVWREEFETLDRARADRAGGQPDRRIERPLRARRAVGLRRPGRLEVLAALLRPPRALPGGGGL